MTHRIERGPVTTKTGTVLTEADFERLADEAEAGYDASEIRAVRVGRPSLSGDTAQSPRIQFRITEAARQAAETVAQQQGVTLSALARQAFDEYLSKRIAS